MVAASWGHRINATMNVILRIMVCLLRYTFTFVTLISLYPDYRHIIILYIYYNIYLIYYSSYLTIMIVLRYGKLGKDRIENKKKNYHKLV